MVEIKEIHKNLIENTVILKSISSGMKIDTPILMYDGSIKKIQDIKIGELVMGDDSTSRQVLSTTIGKDIMYDILPVKGDKYTVSSDHILSLKYSNKKHLKERVSRKSYQVIWFNNIKIKRDSKTFSFKYEDKEIAYKKALDFLNNINENLYIDISVKKYIELSSSFKRYLNGYKLPINFPEILLEIDPYMIGFWLGDGDSNTSKITSQDSSVIHYFKNNLAKYKCYLEYHKSSEYGYRINGEIIKGEQWISNNFLKTLKKYNLLYNKHIPDNYKFNSRENRLKLLAGLIDSDGNLSKNGGFEFTQKNEKVIDDVIYLCRSLGFSCYKAIKNTSWTYKGIKNYGTAFRICINGKGIEQIPTLCPRKKANPRQQIKDVLVSGITVKKLSEDNYYGFELDRNNRFVMGDFTVV